MVTDQTSPVQHQPQAARLTRKKGKKLAEVIAHLHLASVLVLLLAFFILKGNSESVATLTIKKKIADLAAIQASCNRLKYAQTIQGDVRLFDRVASGIGVQLQANHFPATSHPTLKGL